MVVKHCVEERLEQLLQSRAGERILGAREGGARGHQMGLRSLYVRERHSTVPARPKAWCDPGGTARLTRAPGTIGSMIVVRASAARDDMDSVAFGMVHYVLSCRREGPVLFSKTFCTHCTRLKRIIHAAGFTSCTTAPPFALFSIGTQQHTNTVSRTHPARRAQWPSCAHC